MKCFNYHKKNQTNCERVNCRYWINSQDSQMCCINLAGKKENFTLEDVGNIFSVTRMRICQIEKRAIEKLKSMANMRF
jgi:DNA-directed RNA polymerase specialized sigma subunit